MEKRIQIPLALNELVNYTNQEIDRLRNIVASASIEQLRLLGLTMEEGWRLDYEARQFVKIEVPNEEAPTEQ
jgi:hypothetical protein